MNNSAKVSYEERHRVIIETSERLYPKKKSYFLIWISYGVFFGYPEADIISFTKRMLNGVGAPESHPFKGSGYVCTEGLKGSKEEHIAAINARRYCKYPFPLEGYIDISDGLREAFIMQEGFLNKVISIANKVDK